MHKIKLMPVGSGLEVERAISPAERRRILDAADSLPYVGGRSKDRNRYRGQERPMRKSYRPYRNRAIVYTLIETGMRRAAVRNLNMDDVDFKKRSVAVEDKGGRTHGRKTAFLTNKRWMRGILSEVLSIGGAGDHSFDILVLPGS